MSGENIYTHGMWSIVVKKYDPTKLSDEEFMKLLSEGAEFINR